jgi:hypothetical protein
MDFIFCNNCGLRTNQAVELCSHCHKPHTNSKDKPPGSSIYRPSVDEAPSVEELGAKNAGISKLRQDILQKENIGQSKLARLKTLCTRKFPKPGHGYGNKEQPKARLTLKSLPALTRSVEAPPPLTPAPTRPVEAKPAKSYLSQELSGRDVAGLLLGAVGMMGLIVLLAFVHTKIAPENPAKQRERKISEQFSPFNGSHIDLSSLIKSGMNDPKSYEHVSTSYIDKGDCILVRTTFRGKNAFGGVVTNSVTAEVNEDGKIIRVVSSSP